MHNLIKLKYLQSKKHNEQVQQAQVFHVREFFVFVRLHGAREGRDST